MDTLARRAGARQAARSERTFFTVQALAAIREADELSATEKLVLCMIVSHANQRGLAWPSVPTLAKETGLSQRAVYRALTALESAGLLVRRHPATHAGTVYDLSGLSRRAAPLPQGQRGVTLVQSGADGEAQTPDSQSGEEILNKEIKKRVRARRLAPADQPPAAVEAFLRRLT